ncbi:outer membrane lipoprotein LolB [Catenovulum sp. SM1970]|uniref:lipoprotein insertase outer membrane protein LolB n=1 Tax=Marinifaba aquimaris TaxID=2741323 RepID=UPI001573DF3B|nr:lipoprotein insertase outer membrane protein LolB [Marinifaba aquimaris]NTS75988.1 outer membrane lipoprotein LolB [Marinifaba aquimaris]
MFAFLAFMLLLSGCQTTQEPLTAEQLTHIGQIQDFELKGKIAILTPKDKDSINFYWQQTKDEYDIRFTTFLGVEVASIKGNYQSITIEADGKTYQSNEPELLLQEVTGWKIPLRRLSKWVTGNVRGVVMAKHPDTELPKRVLARVSSEEEWMVDYDKYRTVHKLQLPHRLTLKQYKLKINMAINDWTLN